MRGSIYACMHTYIHVRIWNMPNAEEGYPLVGGWSFFTCLYSIRWGKSASAARIAAFSRNSLYLSRFGSSNIRSFFRNGPKDFFRKRGRKKEKRSRKRWEERKTVAGCLLPCFPACLWLLRRCSSTFGSGNRTYTGKVRMEKADIRRRAKERKKWKRSSDKSTFIRCKCVHHEISVRTRVRA